MEETAPFVSLESQDDIWDNETSDDNSIGLQPARINYRHPALCTRSRIAVVALIGALVIVIIVLSVLIAQRKGPNEMKESLCFTPSCITTSYGK
jgi:hypothetical protein